MKSFLSVLVLLGSFSALAANDMKTKATNMKNDMQTSMNKNMQTTQMDDLIRGEMAAVKSYDTVLGKIKDPAEKTQLEAIKQDHVDAVAKLKQFASADVKEDTNTSGAWGAFASAYTGSAKLFGDKAALKALTQGEEHGVREYKEALEDANVSNDVKTVIKTQLLPKQEAHLKTFKAMM